MSKFVIKNPICSICGSKDVLLLNRHFFYSVKCEECDHSYILMEEKKHSSFIKKKDPNRLENSFCPYWTLTKNYKQMKRFEVLLKDNESVMCQDFSPKSLQKFMENTGLSFTISVLEGVAVVTIRD
jgi:hypothetical protein